VGQVADENERTTIVIIIDGVVHPFDHHGVGKVALDAGDSLRTDGPGVHKYCSWDDEVPARSLEGHACDRICNIEDGGWAREFQQGADPAVEVVTELDEFRQVPNEGESLIVGGPIRNIGQIQVVAVVQLEGVLTQAGREASLAEEVLGGDEQGNVPYTCRTSELEGVVVVAVYLDQDSELHDSIHDGAGEHVSADLVGIGARSTGGGFHLDSECVAERRRANRVPQNPERREITQ